jgi:transcription antitermination factor NusG
MSPAVVVAQALTIPPFSMHQHPWYGVRTRLKQEKLAAANLEYRGFQPYLPVYKVRRRWSDRVVTAELPLFPGYVFCRFDHFQRLPVISSPGVASILGCGSQPAPIPDAEIEAVRAIVESGIAAEPVPLLREGQPIRVIHGPLQSLEGTLVRKKSTWRLVVSIEMLQRAVSVEIDPAYVQAI